MFPTRKKVPNRAFLCWVRTILYSRHTSTKEPKSYSFRNIPGSLSVPVSKSLLFCQSHLIGQNSLKGIFGLKAFRHSNRDAGKVLQAQLNTIDLILEFEMTQ